LARAAEPPLFQVDLIDLTGTERQLSQFVYLETE